MQSNRNLLKNRFLFLLNIIWLICLYVVCLHSIKFKEKPKLMNQNFTISVHKLTDEELMRKACEMTFLGTSKQSLLNMYKSEHSPVRTQIFWIECNHIPLFVATHLLRHHVGSVPYQLTCRNDRKGGNPGLIQKLDEIKERMNCIVEEVQSGRSDYADLIISEIQDELTFLQNNSDRYTPVNLGLLINSQSLIDMAKLRLCKQAHKETIEVFSAIKDEISKDDPELAKMMVKKCVYRNGLCGESRGCGYNNSPNFKKELSESLSNFSNLQRGNLFD